MNKINLMIELLLARFLLFLIAKFIYILLFKLFNMRVQMAPYKKSYYLTEEDFN
jgi:hypothetical protein